MFDLSLSVYKTLNILGYRCPEPIILIRKTIRNMKKGDKLLIISDDITTIRDIPNFCRFMKHDLLFFEVNQKPYRFLLQKNDSIF